MCPNFSLHVKTLAIGIGPILLQHDLVLMTPARALFPSHVWWQRGDLNLSWGRHNSPSTVIDPQISASVTQSEIYGAYELPGGQRGFVSKQILIHRSGMGPRILCFYCTGLRYALPTHTPGRPPNLAVPGARTPATTIPPHQLCLDCCCRLHSTPHPTFPVLKNKIQGHLSGSVGRASNS